MKKVIIALTLLIGMASASYAQDAPKKDKKEKKMELKKHVCTAACKNGTHVYAHGEKGHVCTEACKKSM